MARFRSDWKMTTFVVLMLPTVILLGVWQLQRADYKRGLEDAYFDQLGALPQPLQAQQPADFARISVEGRYREPYYLLDNQIKDGQPGYWVLSPFETTAADMLLVNRGWIAQGQTRADLPVLPVLTQTSAPTRLVGMVWPDTGLLPLFGAEASEVMAPGWVRLQRLEWGLLVHSSDQRPALRRIELRLEAGQPGVLSPAPQLIEFGIERHVGYAVQWFGLGIALVVCFFYYGWRRA